MAWGLEARVPFLDKAFLEVAMNIDPQEKMFNKGTTQELDEDGCPKMEKVRMFHLFPRNHNASLYSTFFVKLSTVPLTAK